MSNKNKWKVIALVVSLAVVLAIIFATMFAWNHLDEQQDIFECLKRGGIVSTQDGGPVSCDEKTRPVFF